MRKMDICEICGKEIVRGKLFWRTETGVSHAKCWFDQQFCKNNKNYTIQDIHKRRLYNVIINNCLTAMELNNNISLENTLIDMVCLLSDVMDNL